MTTALFAVAVIAWLCFGASTRLPWSRHNGLMALLFFCVAVALSVAFVVHSSKPTLVSCLQAGSADDDVPAFNAYSADRDQLLSERAWHIQMADRCAYAVGNEAFVGAGHIHFGLTREECECWCGDRFADWARLERPYDWASATTRCECKAQGQQP